MISQTRELSVFDESTGGKSVVDLLADLEAAPAGGLLVTAVGTILYEHTGAAMKGAEVSSEETLRRMVDAAAKV